MSSSSPQETKQQHQKQQKLRLLFVGTGVSTGIPVIGHLDEACACNDALSDPNSPNRRNNVSMLVQEWCDELPTRGKVTAFPVEEEKEETKVSDEKDQKKGQAQEREAEKKSGWGKNVLIDVGKTFRDAYFRTLAPHKITHIDAIVITHEHADACGGLDEVRDVQLFQCVAPDWHWNILEAVPTFASPFCLSTLRKSVSYIVDNSRIQKGFYSRGIKGFEEDYPYQATVSDAKKQAVIDREKAEGLMVAHGGNKPIDLVPNTSTTTSEDNDDDQDRPQQPEPWKPYVIPRRITALDFFLLDENRGPFQFTVTPGGHRGTWFGVPVEHGAGYTCLGYVFGETASTRVVYLSDVSRISETTMKFLQSDIVQPIQVLVVDGLLPLGERTHFSHYTLDQAWELTKELDPKESYCVGMWCKVEHKVNCATMEQMVNEYRREKQNRTNNTIRLEKFTLAHDGLELILGDDE